MVSRLCARASQDSAIASAAQRVLDTSGFVCPGFRHRIFAFKKNVNQATYDSSTSLNLTKAWLS